MVTNNSTRRSKNPNGRRSGTQQNSILEHLSPPNNDTTAADNTNDNGGGRTTRNGGGGGRRRRAPPPPPNVPIETESILQSHPRLSRMMEEAKYEAFVDPFRGITPFFSLSFNDDSHSDNGGGVANNDAATTTANIIDMQSPWMQCEPVLRGECTDWSFERGEDVDVKNMTTTNKKRQELERKGAKKQQQQQVEIVNVDDDSSSVVAVQQLTFSNNSNNTDGENNVRIVQCGCPTIDAWAIQEWDKYQQHLSKKNKKVGKKRKRKAKNVADVEEVTDLSCDDTNVMTIDDDDDGNVNSLAAATPVLIFGQRRKDESCPCDYNPVSVIDEGIEV